MEEDEDTENVAKSSNNDSEEGEDSGDESFEINKGVVLVFSSTGCVDLIFTKF